MQFMRKIARDIGDIMHNNHNFIVQCDLMQIRKQEYQRNRKIDEGKRKIAIR